MVADAYDAMTSTRSYRKALGAGGRLPKSLRDKSGTQFHPAVRRRADPSDRERGEKHGAGHEEDVAHENAPVVGVGSAGLGDLIDASD